MGVTDNFVENASIGGTKKTGDILTITVKDPALAGGSKNVNYTVLAADTLTTIATAIKNAINADASLTAIGVSSTSVGTNITIKSTLGKCHYLRTISQCRIDRDDNALCQSKWTDGCWYQWD
jgi:phage tail sheath gpL-like